MDDFLKRDFHLSDVLTVVTGKILSNRRFDGYYDIMGFLTGDPGITTIGADIQRENAKATILEQHPQLARVLFPNIDHLPRIFETRQAFVDNWLVEQINLFGETLPIKPAKIALSISIEEQGDYVAMKKPNVEPLIIGMPEEPPHRTTRRRPDGNECG